MELMAMSASNIMKNLSVLLQYKKLCVELDEGRIPKAVINVLMSDASSH